ncbi:MAG: P-II family nitrogen regulator [Thermacetogeniaceae bacterium]
MVKIEAILRPNTFEQIKDALGEFGAKGLTVTQVMGCGLQKGRTEVYRGTEFTFNLLPKIKLEIATTDDRADQIVKIICEKARTGSIGDGKIFISKLDNAVRVRTGETGDQALV